MKVSPKLITVLSIITFIVSIAYISGLLKLFGLHLGLVQYVALILMLCLIIAFLIYPAKRGATKDRLPWYDILFMTMGVAGTSYPAFFVERWSHLLYTGRTTMLEVILCLMLILAVFEAARRMIGLAMPLIASFFVVHLIFGRYFPGVLLTPSFSFERMAALFYLSPDGIFGIALQVSCTIVIMFMFFAGFLRGSDAGKYIIDGAFSLTGRWTGGPAKGAVIASSVLGTMTGDTAANVATTGTFTIPLMKKAGYKPEFAGAVESVASNGGQIMPPVMGMVAFIMAELLGMSYWDVCVHALLPALLFYLSLFLQVHFEAVKFGLTGLPRAQLPRLAKVVKGGFSYIIPIGVLIYLLAVARLPAEYACLFALLALIVIILVNWQGRKETRKGPKELVAWAVSCIESGIRTLLLPTAACAIAGVIIGSIGASGLGSRLSSILIDVSGQNVIVLLVLAAVTSFLLGMGMTSIPCYLMLAIIVGPCLVSLGVAPIAAHLFFFYFGIVSFITPPVAVAAFIASGIADSNPMKTGIQAARLGIVTFVVPFIFVFNPSLLLIGSIGEIMLTMISATLGVSFLATAVEGFLMKPLNWLERVIFIGCALLLMWPGWMTDIGGIVLALPVLLWHIKSAKRISHSAEG